MAGKLTRFLNLERARKPGETPAHGVISKERFSGESPPAAPPEDRFRAERAVQPASEVAQAEQSVLDDRTPLGLRLLQGIADPNLRFAVAMGMVVTFFGAGMVVYLAKGHTLLQSVSAIVAGALFVLFMPRSSRRSRFWDDDL